MRDVYVNNGLFLHISSFFSEGAGGKHKLKSQLYLLLASISLSEMGKKSQEVWCINLLSCSKHRMLASHDLFKPGLSSGLLLLHSQRTISYRRCTHINHFCWFINICIYHRVICFFPFWDNVCVTVNTTDRKTDSSLCKVEGAEKKHPGFNSPNIRVRPKTSWIFFYYKNNLL